jgi:hypothetical protein
MRGSVGEFIIHRTSTMIRNEFFSKEPCIRHETQMSS